MPTTLSALLATLFDGEIIPHPAVENWPLMIERIRVPGRINVITEEVYDHFLGCLPPHWMGDGCFAFAEGAEPLSLFWHQSGEYYVRQLTWEETRQFCHHAHISLPN